jgi:long-subunit fatty acid transport protein
MINPTYPAAGFTGAMVSAPTFFTTMQTASTNAATKATNAASGMQPIITGGGGGLTFAQAQGAGIITAAQRAQMEGGLLQLSQGQITQAQIDAMTISQAQGTYTNFATSYTTNAATMGVYAGRTADMEVDAEQKGTSFTPIVSVDLNLLEGNLGIALKYEHKTPLEMKNSTKVDGSGMFPDGEKTPAEMPSLITAGIRYNILDNFRTSVGFHYYMDKGAKYGKVNYANGEFVTNGEETTLPDGTKGAYLDKNSFELGIALEYDVAKNISLSGGYLYASTSPTLAYQTDLGYSLKSQTVGFGGIAHVSENLDINLGASYTVYSDGDKTFKYSDPASTTGGTIDVKELYDKKTTIFSIGLGYRFGK